MHSTDERLNSIKNRTAEIKLKCNIRRRNIIALSSVMSCVAIVITAGIALPSVLAHIFGEEYTIAGAVGSIFSEGNAIGYVVIGLIAFVLGVLVDILCIHLRDKNRKDKHND